MLDEETRLLAAIAYGESDYRTDDADEMYAIASVLVRQMTARGFDSIKSLTSKDKSFSFAVGDGNPRFNALMKATDKVIEKNVAMQSAVDAARNALAKGPDKSNGAWFWDGIDIKTNYRHHPKVKVGIKFTEPSHNIYKLQDSTRLVIKTKKIVVVDEHKKRRVITEEIGRFDHEYDSTAAWGGTIFWKLNDDFLRVTKGKEYR